MPATTPLPVGAGHARDIKVAAGTVAGMARSHIHYDPRPLSLI